MDTNTRDRAFDRIVVVPVKDNERFLSIIGDIPRKDVIKSKTKSDGLFFYLAKLKKQELLAIKLSIEVKSVEKIRKKKSLAFPKVLW